jgi:hypothetical protein
MSWIFHEPLEPAIHVRRTFRSPVVAAPARAYSAAVRFYALDLFAEAAPTAPSRRAAATAAAAPTGLRSCNPAERVLASLLCAGLCDEAPWLTPGRRLSQASYAPTIDIGRSAAVSATFAGRGDDPYGPIGLAVATGEALGVDGGRPLAVQNPAVFGGGTASRQV